MGKCLITKLKDEVVNKNLKKIGEVRVSFSGAGSIILFGTEPIKAEIITEGVYFTNSPFNGMQVQETSVAGARTMTFSDGCEMSITSKYDLKFLQENSPGYMSVDIEQLEYAKNLTMLASNGYNNKGNIKALKECTSLQYVKLIGEGINGDLSDLFASEACYGLIFADTVNTSNIGGDISYLERVPNIVDVIMYNCPIRGSINVFANGFNELREFSSFSEDIEGDIVSFANHPNFKNLQIPYSKVTGTLSQLMIGNTALKGAWIPKGVTYTVEEAERFDNLASSNGGTVTSSGHYFGGGTLID